MPTTFHPKKQKHLNRPQMVELNAARLEAGQIRAGLAQPRVRKQMILRLLSGFGLSTSDLLIRNGATKSDLAELTQAGFIQTNRVRFNVDPRARGRMITIVELTARGRRLAKSNGAVSGWRPTNPRYHQAGHDLLAQSLAIEVSRVIGPVPGRIRSIYSSDSILNRPPADREKLFGGAIKNHLPDSVLSTKGGQVFFEFERTPKTKQLERYRFIRKIIHLACAGRVIIGFPSGDRARKFHNVLVEIERAGWMRESFIWNSAVTKWFQNSSQVIEVGVNDWPDVLGSPVLVDVESGYPESPFWTAFRRAKNGFFVVGNYHEVGQKIPFLSVAEWTRLGRPM